MLERFAAVDIGIEPPQIEFNDKPREECGVAGILAYEETFIAQELSSGLWAEQHRGQEAAGVAVGTPDNTVIMKDTGLVNDALGGTKLTGLQKSHIGVGHVRYGTVNIGRWSKYDAAGPFAAESDSYGSIVVSHNGQLNNGIELCKTVDLEYDDFPTDTAVLPAVIARTRGSTNTLVEATTEVLSSTEGAFSIVVMGENQLIGVRDPEGFRPLWLGNYRDGKGWAFASETQALEAMGATPVREVEPGEMIACDLDGGITPTFPFPKTQTRLCSFEHVYLSAAQGMLMGSSVYMNRRRLGEILATNHPAEADVVVGIPSSANPAALGFANVSGIEKVTGLIKVGYLPEERTFITPGQSNRELAAERKLAVVREEVEGKRVVAVDDSLFRGTMGRVAVRKLKEDGGAREVHLRITSPPVIGPCEYGLDIPDPRRLLANRYPEQAALRDHLGVDSLEYLTPEEMTIAIPGSVGKLCMDCMVSKLHNSKS